MYKILFIVPSLGIGGMERACVTIANKLAEDGNNITVLILDEVCDMASEFCDNIRVIRKPYKMHLGNRIPYICHKFYDSGMWETRASAKTLYKYYVGDEKYDVEIAFFRGLSIKIISGSTNQNAVHLAWVHNDFRKALGYMNNFWSMPDVNKAYSCYDNVICVSNQAAEGFKEVVGDTGNIKVIYNLLPVSDIKKKAMEKPYVQVYKSGFHIVLIGRLLDSAKGQKRLIKVVSDIHKEGFDISLALVGGGNDEKMLEEEIAKQDAEGFITMTGSQTNPYPYIKEADLLVCASFYEGYNLTVAEALVLGVPVLSTDCTGPNEILDRGKYGLIVDNSEEGLYNGIKKFAENRDMLAEYRQKAQMRKSFFDEDKILKQITDLFKRN